MAKFYGKIGFSKTAETVPGVFEEQTVEKYYYGDVIRNVRRWENSGSINDNINISNSISIIADDFAYSNIGAMKYVEWMNEKWKISDVDIQRPRLIISIGGVYNG